MSSTGPETGLSTGTDTGLPATHTARSSVPFLLVVMGFTSIFVLLVIAMLVADASFTSPRDILEATRDPAILFSIKLSLATCSIAAVLSVIFAVPIGYLLSRYSFPGRTILDAIFDIPIVLPPLVIGLSLLILFNQTGIGKGLESVCVSMLSWLHEMAPGVMKTLGLEHVRGITYDIPGIILAQFMVAAAFAIRTMRVTFDQINPRREGVAMTLGCSQGQAFRLVLIPEAAGGIITALTLAWSRALGEFGPILIFAGATRMRTEVLPTSIFLEMNVGNIEAAVAVSLLMVAGAFLVLLLSRWLGNRHVSW